MSKIMNFLKGFKSGFTDFGNNIVIIINSVLLSIVYIIGIGLTSLIAKIFGKHFLSMKISKTKKSYWSDLNLSNKKIDDYYKQF